MENEITPKAQLLADLMQEVVPVRQDVSLDHLAGDWERVLETAHDRARGLFHVTAVDEEGAAYAALRSAPGPDEATDFCALWTAPVTDPSRKMTLSEVLALRPISDRIADAYPGVALASEPMPDGSKSINGSYTLYARGDTAVMSLIAMLRTASERIPLPDWKAQNDKVDFLRTVFDLFREGRSRDMEDLIESYGYARGIDIEELKEEARGKRNERYP
ncbi:hypothetical protein SAZ11_07980 [Streptomyces sp. FXJ1.4098]|nr:hypothetical protein [Streptomyces sp. FXJ1.4098]